MSISHTENGAEARDVLQREHLGRVPKVGDSMMHLGRLGEVGSGIKRGQRDRAGNEGKALRSVDKTLEFIQLKTGKMILSIIPLSICYNNKTSPVYIFVSSRHLDTQNFVQPSEMSRGYCNHASINFEMLNVI